MAELRFEFMCEHRETFAVGLMSSTLEGSRAGFYAWLGRGDSKHTREDLRLTVLIREEHARSTRRSAGPAVHRGSMPR